MNSNSKSNVNKFLNPSFIDNNVSYFEVDFKQDNVSKNSSPEQTEQSISKITNEIQVTKISEVSNQNNNTTSNDQTYYENSKIFGPNISQDTNSFHERYYKIKHEKQKHSKYSKRKVKNCKNPNNLVLANTGKLSDSTKFLIKNMKCTNAPEEKPKDNYKSYGNVNLNSVCSSEKEFKGSKCLLKRKGK